jgi:hypothetical protein
MEGAARTGINAMPTVTELMNLLAFTNKIRL